MIKQIGVIVFPSYKYHRYMQRLLSILLCLTLCLQGEAQSFEPFIHNIREFCKNSPQERVFLDTDCPDGCALGDTIHFTLHAVRLDSLCPTNKSGVAYVDLVSPSKVIVATHKLRLDSLGRASGAVVVDSLYESGFYILRAYTRYLTNWLDANIFTKVVPVYYPDHWISRKERKKHKGAGFINLDNSAYRAKKRKDFHTYFYIESGSFVLSHPSRLAIHCVNDEGVPADASFKLIDAFKEVESTCKLDKYGNGVLSFNASQIRQKRVKAKGKCGKHGFEFPMVKPKGVSAIVDATPKKRVLAKMFFSRENLGKSFCTIILNRGNLVSCDSFVVDTIVKDYQYDKSCLGRGIHELVVFSREGVQMVRRRFFVGEINSEEEQWVLLNSELRRRNMVPRGAYKKLTPQEIDCILMVDGCNVSPWNYMASQPSLTLQQPAEMALMVFGQVLPKSLRPTKEEAQLDGRTFPLTLSQGDKIYKSTIVCDKHGYFGSYFPDLHGEWMLMGHHSDDMTRHDVLIYEDFSPQATIASTCEIQPRLFGKNTWYTPKVDRKDGVLYDCDKFTKQRVAEGLISQSFYGWLGQQNKNLRKMIGAVSPVIVNILPDSAFNKHIDYNFFGTSSDDPRTVAVDGPTYKGRPIVWIIDGQYRMVTGLHKKITDFNVLRPCKRHMPNFVDEVRNVFITEEPTAFHPYVRCSVLESKKPITIFITLHKNYIWNDAGLVTAPFQGLSTE